MQQRKVGKYPFSIDVEGAKPIEAVLVVGKTEGKTLVVTAGVHGDEYVAIQAVRELLNDLQPPKLRGQIILVPIINKEGFYEGTYLVPEDGENLNRCFPGSKKKSVTWRMAHALERSLYPKADFLLDLHGGSPYETMTPLVFFPVGATTVPNGNSTQVVAAGVLLDLFKKASFRSNLGQLGVVSSSHLTSAGCRWLVKFNSHGFTLLVRFRGTLSVPYITSGRIILRAITSWNRRTRCSWNPLSGLQSLFSSQRCSRR